MRTFIVIVIVIIQISISKAQSTQSGLNFNENDEVYQLYLANDQLAKCLDGTQPSFYFKSGFGDGQIKFIVYFEGGGWIGGIDEQATIQDAWYRSQTKLGSSNYHSQTFKWTNGILSRNPEKNPHFHNWNSVFINYCDGTGHQGFRTESIFEKGLNLYFRGEANTRGVIKELQMQFNFERAEYVYVSGCSAGGLATYYWANHFRSLFEESTQVVAGPDSGLFMQMQRLDDKSFDINKYYFQNTMAINNVEVDPINTKCVNDHKMEKWKCLQSSVVVDYIDVPLIFIQSFYDAWSIPNILGINCSDQGNLNGCNHEELEYIEVHHRAVKDLVKKSLKKNKQWSSWVASCVNHCFEELEYFNSEQYNIPVNSGNSISEVLHNWMQNLDGNNDYSDDVDWPFNTQCSGMHSNTSEVELENEYSLTGYIISLGYTILIVLFSNDYFEYII